MSKTITTRTRPFARTTRHAGLLTTLALSLAPAVARADDAAPDPYETRAAVMAGLAQWLVWGGGNVAAQLKTGRLVLEVSHGQSLHLERFGGLGLTKAERDAGVTVAMPWTTGGGAGIRITPELHVLVEVKAHRYEVRGVDRNQSATYTTFTVGPGVFYDIHLWRGLFLQPNVRFWPTVGSTYDGAAVFRRADGSTYAHARHDLPPFLNVNVGWNLDGR